MSNLNSLPAELSPKNQQFCDNLLSLAKWLDSQDVEYIFIKFLETTFAKTYKGKSISHPEFFPLTLEANEFKTGYYANRITNQERVLAVLMLRSAILAGDSFISENV
jgi:hypothetical protein